MFWLKVPRFPTRGSRCTKCPAEFTIWQHWFCESRLKLCHHLTRVRWCVVCPLTNHSFEQTHAPALALRRGSLCLCECSDSWCGGGAVLWSANRDEPPVNNGGRRPVFYLSAAPGVRDQPEPRSALVSAVLSDTAAGRTFERSLATLL